PPERWLLPRGPALSGLAEPLELPLHRARFRPDVQLDDPLQVLDHRGRRLILLDLGHCLVSEARRWSPRGLVGRRSPRQSEPCARWFSKPPMSLSRTSSCRSP